MKTKTFIIGIQNFLAGVIAVRATKGTMLYRKACIGKSAGKGKIVLTTIEELKTWESAISAYQPQNDTEIKIVTALRKAVTSGIANRIAATA
ncbi:MAG: hypothetical protein LBC86_09275 [Oscillospiraceae bacterium]|jgi:hypothetical protein|nr:hypothetical protein [Oscillospiraceae bacterium]